MTGRIIKNLAGWDEWGPIAEDTVIVDDYRICLQYDHGGWYASGADVDTAPKALEYPVEVVWVPSDRDMLHWPEEAPDHPAAQVLAEAASALHTVERTDTKAWVELTEDEKLPYIARVIRPTLAVILTTRPPGWEAIAAEIGTVNQAINHRKGTQ